MIGTGIGIPFRKKKRSVDDVITVNAPTNLVLTVDADDQISMIWDDNSDNEDGFRIYYKAEGGEFAEHGTVLADIEAYEATGLTAGTLYYFYVVAYNGVIESDPTEIIADITNSAELKTYITGLVTPLSNKQRRGIEAGILFLKPGLGISSISEAFDFLYILAGETIESSLKNISKDLHHGVLQGTPNPTHTAFHGVQSDGANGYIDSNYNAKTQSSVHTLNAASIGVYSKTQVQEDRSEIGARISSTSTQSYMLLWNSSGRASARINQGSASGAINALNTKSYGMFVGVRTASNVVLLYRYLSELGSGTSNSTDFPNFNVYLCALNQNGSPAIFSTKQISLAFYGKLFTESNIAVINQFFDIYVANNASDFFVFDGYSKPFSPQNLNPAVCYNNKTYIAYNANDDDPYILFYNHLSQLYSHKIQIGVNPVKTDRHEQPALLIDDLGYIHCFFGCHNTAIKYSKSTNPEDITAWTAMADIDTDATYPQIFQLSTGVIYLFYRRYDDSEWGYRTTDDYGTTWSDFVPLLDWWAYSYVQVDNDDKIHITFNQNIGTDPFDRKDIHYMYYDGSEWKDILGNTLSMPLATGTVGTLVYDTDLSTVHAELRLFNHKPFLYFAEIDEANEFDYVFKFAKYDSGWQVSDIVTTTLSFNYNKGVMDVISESIIHIYQMVADKFEKWVSVNGGTTWAKDSEIFDDGKFYIDPILVYGGRNDARYLFQENGAGAEKNLKVYLYGNKGFV